jgi:hypothetical protein
MQIRLRSYLSLLIALIIIAHSGCGGTGRPKIAAQSIELADKLTSPPPAPGNDVPSKNQRVYIDASWSMGGFIGKTSSSGRTAFDEFIDAMPDVLPGCEVYKYGQAGKWGQSVEDLRQITTKAEFDAKLHEPATYQLTFNPDDALFKQLVSQKEPELSIILTDGVESDDKGQVNTVVVDAIRSWMNEGNIFAILMMKSRFSGKFYSESQRRMIGNVTAEERPFFAFILAPSRREFDDLAEKVKRRFAQVKVMLFSDDAVSCRVELPSGIRGDYANESPPNKPYYWQMLTAGDLQTDSEDTLLYKYVFDIKDTYPVKTFGLRLNTTQYRWDGVQKVFGQEPSPVSTSIDVADSAGNDGQGSRTQTYVLSTSPLVRARGQEDYQFFSIETSAYVKEVADDISGLSTRDDSTPANAGKTYRFQELVLALLDVHLKNRILPRASPRLYLTVTHL